MTTSLVDIGVNVAALLGAREAFADAPEIARFQWRSSVSWVNGAHSEAEVEAFSGFGEEQRHSKRFAFDIDHPVQFAAEDNGITPPEFVLVLCMYSMPGEPFTCSSMGTATVCSTAESRLLD